MVCAFFGHKDTPDAIRDKLLKVVREIIEEKKCKTFMVGNQGHFDSMVYSVLCDCRKMYPQITINIILAYMPAKKQEYEPFQYCDTVYPEGLETVPVRFAISHRNRWMVEQADIVVAYITHTWGGAIQAVNYAKTKKLEVLNLADQE